MSTVYNTGTATRPASFSQREDLANFISNIVRDDIPFMSSIGKGKASAVNHEWSTDSLARPAAQAIVEGADYSTPTATPDVARLGNYSQIFNKRIEVSGTIEVVSKAGRKSEFKYQSEKRGKELMRDIEFALVSERGAKASGQTRKFGGYQAWVPAGNTIEVGNTGAPTAAATGRTVGLGDGTNIQAAATASTAAGFALSFVDDIMQAVWQNGGRPSTLMMSPSNKRAFSVQAQGQTTAANGNNVRRNIDDSGKLTQSVTMYESDFGMVKVVPNYIMAASNLGSGAAASHTDTDILVYDSSAFKMATLRPLHHRDISENGDQLRAMMVHETTLECMNPEAVGLIMNLT